MDNLLVLPSKYKKKSLSKKDEDKLIDELIDEIRQKNVTRIGESLAPGEFAASTKGIFFDEYDMY